MDRNFCRLCLKPDNWRIPLPIFGDGLSLPAKINAIFGIQVVEDDILSKVMCHTCLAKIEFIEGFKKEVRKGDLFLTNLFMLTNKVDEIPPSDTTRSLTDVSSTLSDSGHVRTVKQSTGKLSCKQALPTETLLDSTPPAPNVPKDTKKDQTDSRNISESEDESEEDPEETRKKKEKELTWIVCQKCNFVTQRRCAMLSHMRKHGRMAKCSKCDCTFLHQDEFIQHLKEVHGQAGSEDSYVCEICRKTFLRKHNLESHKRVHVKSKREPATSDVNGKDCENKDLNEVDRKKASNQGELSEDEQRHESTKEIVEEFLNSPKEVAEERKKQREDFESMDSNIKNESKRKKVSGDFVSFEQKEKSDKSEIESSLKEPVECKEKHNDKKLVDKSGTFLDNGKEKKTIDYSDALTKIKVGEVKLSSGNELLQLKKQNSTGKNVILTKYVSSDDYRKVSNDNESEESTVKKKVLSYCDSNLIQQKTNSAINNTNSKSAGKTIEIVNESLKLNESTSSTQKSKKIEKLSEDEQKTSYKSSNKEKCQEKVSSTKHNKETKNCDRKNENIHNIPNKNKKESDVHSETVEHIDDADSDVDIGKLIEYEMATLEEKINKCNNKRKLDTDMLENKEKIIKIESESTNSETDDKQYTNIHVEKEYYKCSEVTFTKSNKNNDRSEIAYKKTDGGDNNIMVVNQNTEKGNRLISTAKRKTENNKSTQIACNNTDNVNELNIVAGRKTEKDNKHSQSIYKKTEKVTDHCQTVHSKTEKDNKHNQISYRKTEKDSNHSEIKHKTEHKKTEKDNKYSQGTHKKTEKDTEQCQIVSSKTKHNNEISVSADSKAGMDNRHKQIAYRKTEKENNHSQTKQKTEHRKTEKSNNNKQIICSRPDNVNEINEAIHKIETDDDCQILYSKTKNDHTYSITELSAVAEEKTEKDNKYSKIPNSKKDHAKDSMLIRSGKEQKRKTEIDIKQGQSASSQKVKPENVNKHSKIGYCKTDHKSSKVVNGKKEKTKNNEISFSRTDNTKELGVVVDRKTEKDNKHGKTAFEKIENAKQHSSDVHRKKENNSQGHVAYSRTEKDNRHSTTMFRKMNNDNDLSTIKNTETDNRSQIAYRKTEHYAKHTDSRISFNKAHDNRSNAESISRLVERTKSYPESLNFNFYKDGDDEISRVRACSSIRKEITSETERTYIEVEHKDDKLMLEKKVYIGETHCSKQRSKSMKNRDMIENNRFKYECNGCFSVFSTLRDLVVHKRTHKLLVDI